MKPGTCRVDTAGCPNTVIVLMAVSPWVLCPQRMPRHRRARFTCSLHFRHRQLNLCLAGVLEPRCSEVAWGNGSLRYLFENYALDTDRRELRRGAELVAIPPQVFDLLDYLIRNREHVVSKDDLIEAIWKGRIVSETALTTRLNAARSAIGDYGRGTAPDQDTAAQGLPFRRTRCGKREKPARPQVAGTRRAAETALALPDKPSIAVLPFENMSGDPEQEYFADGMVDDITTALSRFKSAVRHRPQFELHLQRACRRYQAGRARAWRALRA